MYEDSHRWKEAAGSSLDGTLTPAKGKRQSMTRMGGVG